MALLLDAPLKISNVLSTGTGDPTTTRATTKNVFDNEGKLLTLRSGGRTFGGARCVQNIIRTTENMHASAQWTISANGVKVVANLPNGLAGAMTYSCNTNATNQTAHQTSYTTGVNAVETIALRFLYKPGISDGWCAVHIYSGANIAKFLINTSTHSTGTSVGVGTGFTPISHTIAESTDYPGWYEADFVATVPASTLILMLIRHVDSNSSTDTFTAVSGREITIAYPQGENVTGQTDQTVSEYVSVGVLAAPYHGGGADGVKFFATNKDLTAISDATLLGDNVDAASKTNNALWCRDFTNAAWVKTNITAAKTQTGITGQTNSCSLLTCGTAGGTALQTIVAAAAAGCSGFWVKRGVGTGTIEITRDNGSTWTDVTSLINTSTFTKVKIENTSVTNPVVGFRMGTVNDTIIVDAGLNHLGTVLCEPIFTTTANVTRNADVQSYPVAANFSDTAGTILARVYRDNWTNNHDGLIGATTSGLGTLATNSGVKGFDGLNTVNGPLGVPTNTKYLAIRWSGTTLEALSNGVPGTAGSYDGSFGLPSIGIGVGGISNIRDVKIYDTALTNIEIAEAFGLSRTTIWDNDAAMDFFDLNSYNGTYNDAMLKWLQAYFSVTGKTLPDLVARYIALNGPYLP